MMSRKQLVAKCVGFSLLAVLASNSLAQVLSPSEVRAEQLQPTIAVLHQVSRRDTRGRIEKFFDAQGRVYTVAYDDRSQIESVRKRSDRVYVDDLLFVEYSENRLLVSIRFGDGNVWHFAYSTDGTQYVHDRFGNSIVRQLDSRGTSMVLRESDATQSMASNLTRLDELLKALNN